MEGVFQVQYLIQQTPSSERYTYTGLEPCAGRAASADRSCAPPPTFNGRRAADEMRLFLIVFFYIFHV